MTINDCNCFFARDGVYQPIGTYTVEEISYRKMYLILKRQADEDSEDFEKIKQFQSYFEQDCLSK